MIHDCTDPNCIGRVDSRNKINLHEFLPNLLISVVPHAVPCDRCGRLHWLNGEIVKDDKTRELAYLVGGKDGKIVFRPAA